MERFKSLLENVITQISYTEITWIGVIEILIIAVIAYQVVLWIKNTKAWMLLKGIVFIGGFILFAEIFEMSTILYLAEKSMNVIALTAVVVFQPEIRRALENLGQKNILSAITPFDKKDNEKIFGNTTEGIIDACVVMSKVKTGALIVIENQVRLTEYEQTGIELDAIVSSQILVNIFEHNTPLHDGAIIVREDRIKAATCYLPLSDNMNLNKNLGTRHRAAVGMSEVSDAMIVVVSEETGNISVAENGIIYTNITVQELRDKLTCNRVGEMEQNRTPFVKKLWKGDRKHEKKDSL